MRILGIDYGDRRIGVAASDPFGWTAQGIRTVQNKGIQAVLEEFRAIFREYQPEKIILGMPKNMDGTLGFRAEATEAFRKELETIFDGEIIYWDERLSTVGASRFLNETNTRGKNRKNIIDTVSACIILEGYLNSLKNNG